MDRITLTDNAAVQDDTGRVIRCFASTQRARSYAGYVAATERETLHIITRSGWKWTVTPCDPPAWTKVRLAAPWVFEGKARRKQ